MYTISTATLVSIVALAFSLSVVVQAYKDHTKVFHGCCHCTDSLPARNKTCEDWRWEFYPQLSNEELTLRITTYNTDVNPECTDLIKGDRYCLEAHGCQNIPDPVSGVCQRGVNGDR